MMTIINRLGKIFNPWVMLASLIFGGCLLAVTITYLWGTQTTNSPPEASGISLSVIPAPTNTLPPPTPSPTLEVTVTEEISPSPPSGDMSIGAYVQVNGTGEDGLRFRDGPGLEYIVLFIGLEAEVFQVEDGPQESDGYEWWLLAAPYDLTVRGWAVSNYLLLIQNP